MQKYLVGIGGMVFAALFAAYVAASVANSLAASAKQIAAATAPR